MNETIYNEIYGREDVDIEDYRQLTCDNWSKIAPIENKTQYNKSNSILYKGYVRYVKVQEYIDNDMIVEIRKSFKIIFTLGDTDTAGLISTGNCGLGYCNWYDEYFEYSPDDITFVECRGEKCRRWRSVLDKGKWCMSCHGDLEKADQLDILIKPLINFNEIPMESLLAIVEYSRHENPVSYISNDDEY